MAFVIAGSRHGALIRVETGWLRLHVARWNPANVTLERALVLHLLDKSPII